MLSLTTSNVGEALNDLLQSIANEENGVANLINAEVNKIISSTVSGLPDVVRSVEQLLRTIVKKNIVLETKTQDILDSATALAGRPGLGVNLGSLLTGLVAILGSIANEEFRLGDLIGQLAVVINRISAVGNPAQLVAANQLVN